MSTIIAVTNAKGGVGKSTTAVHLAVWLREHGHHVLLADCDSQQSSSQWIAEACPEMDAVNLTDSDDVLDNLPTHARGFEYVICDGPGSNNETSRALLLLADLAIIPCKASMLEVRALIAATKILTHARDVRRDGSPPAHIVLNMVRSNTRLTADMQKAAEALNLPIAKTFCVLRQAYADAPGKGTLVWKMGRQGRVAATEIDKIFTELLPVAVKKKQHPAKRGP